MDNQDNPEVVFNESSETGPVLVKGKFGLDLPKLDQFLSGVFPQIA